MIFNVLLCYCDKITNINMFCGISHEICKLFCIWIPSYFDFMWFINWILQSQYHWVWLPGCQWINTEEYAYGYTWGPFNSLAPGGFENIFQNVFFKLISWIDTLSNSCETALRSMPQNPSDDKSTLVQVMAWCRQAASHYLSQCCPRSLSPYGVTRPQWVNMD